MGYGHNRDGSYWERHRVLFGGRAGVPRRPRTRAKEGNSNQTRNQKCPRGAVVTRLTRKIEIKRSSVQFRARAEFFFACFGGPFITPSFVFFLFAVAQQGDPRPGLGTGQAARSILVSTQDEINSSWLMMSCKSPQELVRAEPS